MKLNKSLMCISFFALVLAGCTDDLAHRYVSGTIATDVQGFDLETLTGEKLANVWEESDVATLHRIFTGGAQDGKLDKSIPIRPTRAVRFIVRFEDGNAAWVAASAIAVNPYIWRLTYPHPENPRGDNYVMTVIVDDEDLKLSEQFREVLIGVGLLPNPGGR